MYPNELSVTLKVGRLAEVLEGAQRPGHFRWCSYGRKQVI